MSFIDWYYIWAQYAILSFNSNVLKQAKEQRSGKRSFPRSRRNLNEVSLDFITDEIVIAGAKAVSAVGAEEHQCLELVDVSIFKGKYASFNATPDLMERSTNMLCTHCTFRVPNAD